MILTEDNRSTGRGTCPIGTLANRISHGQPQHRTKGFRSDRPATGSPRHGKLEVYVNNVWGRSSCLTANTLFPATTKTAVECGSLAQRKMQLAKGFPTHHCSSDILQPRLSKVTSPCSEHPLNITTHEARLQSCFPDPRVSSATLSSPHCLQRPSAQRVRVESPRRTFTSWLPVWFGTTVNIVCMSSDGQSTQRNSDVRTQTGPPPLSWLSVRRNVLRLKTKKPNFKLLDS